MRDEEEWISISAYLHISAAEGGTEGEGVGGWEVSILYSTFICMQIS